MKKQLPALILAVVCALLAVMLNNTRKELAALEIKFAESSRPLTKPTAPNQSADVTPAAEPTVAAALPAGEDMTNAVNPQTVEKTLKNHQRIMSSMANMRENPTMNKVIEASQRGTIGALYSDLIEYLDLGPEETTFFMDLLMARQMENVDFGMKLMSGQMTEEEKAEMAAHLKTVGKEMKDQMKTFLNSPEDYEEFEYYEKTMNERMALSQLDQQLASIEQPLTDESYRNLLDLMHDERSGFDWTTDLHDQEKSDISPERFSKENMEKHTDDVGRLNEQIFEKALRILTPEQLAAFKASVTATTDMQLAQFEMAGQLLRGDD